MNLLQHIHQSVRCFFGHHMIEPHIEMHRSYYTRRWCKHCHRTFGVPCLRRDAIPKPPRLT